MLSNTKISLFFFIGLLILPCVFVWAKKSNSTDYPTSFRPETKVQKHFDLDENKILNLYEMSLIRTYLQFGYTLVKKNKQMPYDFNHNAMLEPDEEKIYLLDKKNGTLRPTITKK